MRQGIRRLVVVASCIALGASGCTSTSRVWMGDTTAAAALPEAKRGDRVLLLLRDGSTRLCPVQGYDAEFFYGCRDPVSMTDIEEVRFRRFAGEPAITLSDLAPGHAVTIRTTARDTRHFLLTGIDANSLQGEDVEVALSEVAGMVATRHPLKPGARTVLTSLAGLAVGAGLVMLYVLSRVAANSE